MKKNLLWTLLVIGINVSAFGVYYVYRVNSSVRNNQSPENESRPVPGTGTNESGNDGRDQGDDFNLWRALAWKDKNGQIPPNAITNAIKERDSYLNQQIQQEITPVKADRPNLDSIEPLGVANTNWTPIGPQNVGGRTRSVIVHPTNPNIIWAGTEGGGVWKSTDGGTTWNAMNGNLQNFTIGSMAIDPNNPNILYAGTEKGLPDGGIYKTTDGGMTWNRLEGATPYPGTDPWVWASVYRISIDPNDSNIILAATQGGLKRSVTAGEGDRSSWTDVGSSGNIALDVAFDPSNGSNAVAVIRVGTSGEIYRVAYSTNSGVTWTTANLDSGVYQKTKDYTIKLAYSKITPNNIVYATYLIPAIGIEGTPGYVPAKGGIATSTDGGQNFTSKAATGLSNTAGDLWVSPNDPNFIVVGGYNLFRSTDGGNNFNQISGGYILTVQPHVDQHCIVPDPGFNGTTDKKVYVCTDGGVYHTDDITTVFFNPAPGHQDDSNGWARNDLNFQTTQYYSVAGNGDTGLILGGVQDNASLRLGLLPTKQNAIFLFGGDGASVAVDPMDDNYCYGSFFNLTLQRSHNCHSSNPTSDGYIWVGTPDEQGGFIGRISDKYSYFIAPFVLDPNNRDRMLWGGEALWKTDNVRASGQPTWIAIHNSFTTNPDAPVVITAIAVAPGNSNIIWIGLSNGGVYKTNNGLAASPTWIPIDDNGSNNPFNQQNQGEVLRILIDKDDSNIVYVAFGGFTDGNLQRTYNGGSNWSDITGAGLPNVPIRAIARNPNNPNKLYIGTEIGIFRSDNIGTTWHAVLDGPANVAVWDLEYMSGNSTTLLAATYGRGLWANDEEATPSTRTLFDFDGDARADVSVFRPSNMTTYADRSVSGFLSAQFGQGTDKPVARDYDGDRKADIAVWRPSTGYWYRLNSSDNTFVSVQWGQQGDVPVPGDYDGDNKADQAVFRPSTGTWYLNQSMSGYTSVNLGAVGDLPSVADFDGDGKADEAVFRPSNGSWYLMQSTSGLQPAIQFGTQGDIPAAADYDGDSKADIAVFRPSAGTWYRLNSSNGAFVSVPWGQQGDVPVPADYDGDSKADVAIWRPSTGYWHLLESANGYRSEQFGSNGDIPIPSAP